MHIHPEICLLTLLVVWQGAEDVAVKVFKGEVSPDGRAADEIAVTCYVDHPHLTRCSLSLSRPRMTASNLQLA